MKKLVSLIIFFLSPIIIAQVSDKGNRINKPSLNDHYIYIAANNIMMWLSNNGDGSHDPRTDSNGLYWPGGEDALKSAVFEDGLIFGAKVNNEIRVNGNTHRQGLQAGKIIDGKADDPALPKYRVYKIKKDWEKLPVGSERTVREKDYNEWPIEDGAPYIDVDEDGKPTPGIDKPKHLGDETLWYVANDLDTNRSTFTYGSYPMGLEFQTTVYAVNKFGPLGDAVFKKYRIINKGNYELNDMYLGYWSDPDLGDAGDDYLGCDTMHNVAFAWNSDADVIYGENPPAIGYIFLQGPIIPGGPDDSAFFNDRWIKNFINLNFTSFVPYFYNPWSPPQFIKADHIYNMLQGFMWDGTEQINPHTGNPTKFALTGDPESGTGWYEGEGWPNGFPPGDRRMINGMGPFNMSPGDTQEVVIGIFLAKGSSNKNSVTRLKVNARIIQKIYVNDLTGEKPESPIAHSVPVENSAVIWWEKNTESFVLKDEFLPDTMRFTVNDIEYIIPVEDGNYKFEGYRLWQFSDKEGSDPVLLAVADIINNIKEIRHFSHEYILLNGGTIPSEPLIISPDSGLFNYFIINEDAYSKNKLNNGSPYYFGVTAYAYSEYSDPPVIESEPFIIEVIPGRPPVDAEYPYLAISDIYFEHSEGAGDGTVHAKVIDPHLLTGHSYEVKFNEFSFYNLIDKTESDTLISVSIEPGSDSLRKNIIDGFILLVDNTGLTNLGYYSSRPRYIREIKGPGGTDINPVDVFTTRTSENKNSTGEWTIVSVDFQQRLTYVIQDLLYGHTGKDDYEIRFTEAGSEYYSSGYTLIGPIERIDPKGKGRVPFEIWKIPSDTSIDPIRLVIKIFDFNRDTAWTINPVTNLWETIYTFEPTGSYPDPFPPKSTYETGANSKVNYRIGNTAIKGTLPQPGTVIRLTTWKPLSSLDKFTAVMTAPKLKSTELAKKNINAISAFPNPYFRTNLFNQYYPEYIRFTNLPQKITIRLFSLAGVFIKKIEKDDEGQYADWDLKNKDGYRVASGVYLAYLEIPGTAVKVMKIALVD